MGKQMPLLAILYFQFHYPNFCDSLSHINFLLFWNSLTIILNFCKSLFLFRMTFFAMQEKRNPHFQVTFKDFKGYFKSQLIFSKVLQLLNIFILSQFYFSLLFLGMGQGSTTGGAPQGIINAIGTNRVPHSKVSAIFLMNYLSLQFFISPQFQGLLSLLSSYSQQCSKDHLVQETECKVYYRPLSSHLSSLSPHQVPSCVYILLVWGQYQ